MKENDLFANRVTTLGVSVAFHSYYAFLQNFIKVNTFITFLWGIVNLGLVYRLVVSSRELRNKKYI
ncbi:hypothetical protein GCM10008904_07270 [Paraclostridium ghonii]|uniref:Uncharacterized protein n=1 Tax=Paraclostridium ghonii TaxID=29358 RepID=A0ABU0N2S6_9FIRM|nr:hypothetical protein [Paeniclostridium ghonii]MDQ0557462.1 hypothetical protein [Paeniclostridium ghonii]